MGFAPGPGTGNSSIAGSTDVALNSVTNNDTLSYDQSAAKWKNVAIGSGGGGGVPPATVVVAAADAPASVKSAADYVCSGNADDVQINQAIAAVANDTISLGGQGGTVLLWGRQFRTAAAIRMRSQVTLRGLGQFSTIIRPTSAHRPGEDGGVIELYSPDTQYTTVTDLGIHGNGWGAADSSCCGVYYHQGAGTQYDSSHRLLNMYIYATSHHGIRLRGGPGSRSRAAYLSNIRIIEAGTTITPSACGVWMDSYADSFLIGVDTGTSAGHGFLISGSNNRLVSCKAWFSGSLASAKHQGSGFYINGVRNQLTGCEAQDNYGDGFHIRAADNSISASAADSNGYNRAGGNGAGGWTGSGFYIIASRMTLQGNAFDKNEGGRGLYQRYAVELGSSNMPGIIVQVSSGASAEASLGGSAPHANAIVNVV